MPVAVERVINEIITSVGGSGLAPSDLQIPLVSTAGLLDSVSGAPFRARLGGAAGGPHELVMVRSISGGVAQLNAGDRGIEGTTAQTWPIGTPFEPVVTGAFLESLQGLRIGDPTGVLDSAAFMESTLNALPAHSTVRLAPGRYRITRGLALSMADDVTLLCDGVRVFMDRPFPEDVFGLLAGNNLEFDNLSIFGASCRVQQLSSLTVLQGSAALGTLHDAPSGGLADAQSISVRSGGYNYFYGRDVDGFIQTDWWVKQAGAPGANDFAIVISADVFDALAPQQGVTVVNTGVGSNGPALGFHWYACARVMIDGRISGISPLTYYNVTSGAGVHGAQITFPAPVTGQVSWLLFRTRGNQPLSIPNLFKVDEVNLNLVYTDVKSDGSLIGAANPDYSTIILPGQLTASSVLYPAKHFLLDDGRTHTVFAQRITPANSNDITIGQPSIAITGVSYVGATTFGDGVRYAYRFTVASHPYTEGTIVQILGYTGTGAGGVDYANFNKPVYMYNVTATTFDADFGLTLGTTPTPGGTPTIEAAVVQHRPNSYQAGYDQNNGIRALFAGKRFTAKNSHIEGVEGCGLNDVGGSNQFTADGGLIRCCGLSSFSPSVDSDTLIRHVIYGESGLSVVDSEPEAAHDHQSGLRIIHSIFRNWNSQSYGLHIGDTTGWARQYRFEVDGLVFETFMSPKSPWRGGAQCAVGRATARWTGYGPFNPTNLSPEPLAFDLITANSELELLSDGHGGVQLQNVLGWTTVGNPYTFTLAVESGSVATFTVSGQVIVALNIGDIVVVQSGNWKLTFWQITSISGAGPYTVVANNVNTPVVTGLGNQTSGSIQKVPALVASGNNHVTFKVRRRSNPQNLVTIDAPNSRVDLLTDDGQNYTYKTGLVAGGAPVRCGDVGVIAAAPTSGTYEAGAIGRDPGGSRIWLCTVGGSPGTWVHIP